MDRRRLLGLVAVVVLVALAVGVYVWTDRRNDQRRRDHADLLVECLAGSAPEDC